MTRAIFLLVVAATVASAPLAVAQPPPRDALVTCLAADASYEPIWPTKSFPVSGKQIVCVFRLGEDEAFAKLTSNWVAVDVGEAAPPNTLIAKADLDLQGQRAGKLRYSQPGPLPVGKYRLDVLADAKPWKSVEFSVEADPKPLQIAKPQDLLPLEQGQTWTYQFVQEAGPGGKLSAAGEKLDPDGKLRATVTLTVGDTDQTGTDITVKRNGKTMTQEWWMLDRTGLLATLRKSDGEVLRLDPPQPLLPLVEETYHAWTYEPKDGAFHQAGQLWSSLPIKSAVGEKPGYLTVVEQRTPLGKIIVERHFIPGVGMVHETITSSVGGKLLSRQTMMLRAPKSDG